MANLNSSTIGDILTRSASRAPNSHAITFEDRTWTFRELDHAVTCVATRLLELGLVKGDRVAAFGKNSDAYVLLWLGVARAGLIHVPVNFALTDDELAYILNQSGSRAVFSDQALLEEVERCGATPEIVGTIRKGEGERDILAWAFADTATDAEFDVSDDDVAQILYTSGTTALPKGAVLTHRALVHHYASACLALDIKGSDRLLQALPLYHSAQMHVFMMTALLMGARSWILEVPAPLRILDAIEEHQINSFFAAPTVWISLANLIEKDPARVAHLTHAYYGASIMPTPVLQRLRAAVPALGFYNCFGQSEMGPLCTVLRPEDHDARPAAAGRAIPFVNMRVVDDEMNDVAPGEVGEVVYQSPQLCNGYWEMPEETAEAFHGGWFHSGDLANIDDEGFITIVDRKKDVINAGGIVVSSREVEEALFTHDAVHEVAVIPVPDQRRIEAVGAVVVLEDGQTVTVQELRDHARGRLAEFKVPRHVWFVDALPKNSAGKVQKVELRAKFNR